MACRGCSSHEQPQPSVAPALRLAPETRSARSSSACKSRRAWRSANTCNGKPTLSLSPRPSGATAGWPDYCSRSKGATIPVRTRLLVVAAFGQQEPAAPVARRRLLRSLHGYAAHDRCREEAVAPRACAGASGSPRTQLPSRAWRTAASPRRSASRSAGGRRNPPHYCFRNASDCCFARRAIARPPAPRRSLLALDPADRRSCSGDVATIVPDLGCGHAVPRHGVRPKDPSGSGVGLARCLALAGSRQRPASA